MKEKYETDANEILNLNITNLRTVAEIAAFRNPRLEAVKETDKNLQYLRRRENFYMHLWRWLGRLAHLGFLLGLGLLLAFAIKNM